MKLLKSAIPKIVPYRHASWSACASTVFLIWNYLLFIFQQSPLVRSHRRFLLSFLRGHAALPSPCPISMVPRPYHHHHCIMVLLSLHLGMDNTLSSLGHLGQNWLPAPPQSLLVAVIVQLWQPAVLRLIALILRAVRWVAAVVATCQLLLHHHQMFQLQPWAVDHRIR